MFRYVNLRLKDTPDGNIKVKIHKKILYEPLTQIMDKYQIAEFCYKFNKFIGKKCLEGENPSTFVNKLVSKINSDKDFLDNLNDNTDYYGNVNFEDFLS